MFFILFYLIVNNQKFLNSQAFDYTIVITLNSIKHIQTLSGCKATLGNLIFSHNVYLQKEYARYKQSKGWKHLVVYKSGIHALGLYTSLFISQSAMVWSIPLYMDMGETSKVYYLFAKGNVTG